jgi:hypothetical protein
MSRKIFDANFPEKHLANHGLGAHAIRMKNKIKQGDYIQVDGHYYIVSQIHSESVFCRNAYSGQTCFIDYCDIENHIVWNSEEYWNLISSKGFAPVYKNSI